LIGGLLKISEYIAIIQWKRNQEKFTDNSYSRQHLWKFDGGVEISASSSRKSPGKLEALWLSA
jgi:hypothetical protein